MLQMGQCSWVQTHSPKKELVLAVGSWTHMLPLCVRWVPCVRGGSIFVWTLIALQSPLSNIISQTLCLMNNILKVCHILWCVCVGDCAWREKGTSQNKRRHRQSGTQLLGSQTHTGDKTRKKTLTLEVVMGYESVLTQGRSCIGNFTVC